MYRKYLFIIINLTKIYSSCDAIPLSSIIFYMEMFEQHNKLVPILYLIVYYFAYFKPYPEQGLKFICLQ
jgi:hypothetical protein